MAAAMSMDETLRARWLQLRERLLARQLLGAAGGSLSLRVPGATAMWFGLAADLLPRRVAWPEQDAGLPRGESRGGVGAEAAHAAAYRARADAGAVALGGGAFGRALADFGAVMPQLFDEQARHLGPTGSPVAQATGLARSLQPGGNVLLLHGEPLCIGTTATRLALNAELFEKCAKAQVLAVATGGSVRPLPWWVRLVANRRLDKDRQRAAQRFAQGLLPEETKGY